MLKEVDVVLDMEYIMQDLAKAELEEEFSFEESYKYGLDFINNL